MIESIKDLERLLKLCRKQGVTKITTAAVSLEFGDMPVKHPNESIEDEENSLEFPDEPLTPEELIQFANGA